MLLFNNFSFFGLFTNIPNEEKTTYLRGTMDYLRSNPHTNEEEERFVVSLYNSVLEHRFVGKRKELTFEFYKNYFKTFSRDYLHRKYAEADEDTDELDFYTSLVEDGYTTSMVKDYEGEEVGSSFEKFCTEHGLLT